MPFPRRLLTDGEDLVLDLRPHWIALVEPILETILIVVAMGLALGYMPNSWPDWVRWAVVILAIVLILVRPVRLFIAWITSHFVVTTDRLIHRVGLIAKRSMEIPLEKISDVRFHQNVFERAIGAGDLTIESPGEFGQETFAHVQDPENVQKTIYAMSEENQRRMTASAAPPPAQPSLADELAKLDRLRDDGVISEEEFEAQKARLLGGS